MGKLDEIIYKILKLIKINKLLSGIIAFFNLYLTVYLISKGILVNEIIIFISLIITTILWMKSAVS
jgi:hypothetical protein